MEKKFANLQSIHASIVVVAMFVGCQTAAPIHVWVPPKLNSAVGCKVVIAPITGDAKIAGPLLTQMIAHAPRDAGRALTVTESRANSDNPTIRLVSSVEGEQSDIISHALARRQDADFLLTGEIVRQPSELRLESQREAQGLKEASLYSDGGKKDKITVSWKLTDLRSQGGSNGFPVVTMHDSTLDPQGIAKAAAEDAWKLITPHVIEDNAKLVVPRVSLGSSVIRRGNEAAIAGDWMAAESEWNRVLSIYPRNHAAMHNLAIAAAARQDFEAASKLIGSALKASNKPLYRETAVWIETKQRDYHQAFQLADPPTGWSAVRR